MVLDFDVNDYCKKLRLEHGPPYKCPLIQCSRSYKSMCGLQYHLSNYDHDNPTPQTPVPITPKQKKGRARASAPVPLSPSRDTLTYDEAQKMVQFELDGRIVRMNMTDDMPVMTQDEIDSAGFESSAVSENVVSESLTKLPEPSFKELEDYNICDAPARPNAYIRFIEKSAEELDGEVEYDVDEEDTAWLYIMNDKRDSAGLSPVSVDTLELLMDRLEKESYFQAAANGQPSSNVVVDDDAVCCICMDGECQNTNVILFCDMCNLAVHQDCYGVPYIPEGQWLCRRCLQSPSRAVDCVLCPNHGGAFKQTDRSHWAHVVCALWIPEVRFANTVFLEPIDSIETIPAARWKLTCYVCKQRGVGACIQCHKTNCYAAFHVTCAQQAGLYMKMDTVKDTGDSQPVLVQKTAYCDAHTPADSESKKEDSRQRMKQARKILAKKRSTVPVILIPTIPPERIQEIGALVSIAKKSQFIQRLIAYWTLKRQFRNGVPLLRRLQSAQGGPRDAVNTQNVDTIEMCRQLKYWQCLRQDLERARLLCELVRKREKLKVEFTKAKERCLNVQLKPLEASMRRLLDLIAAKDQHEIFLDPVDQAEVPDYSSVVTNPMDLSTMKMKLDNGDYPNLTTMETDFDLMIANCLAYNSRDTLFYRAGIKMRDHGAALFKQAKQEFKDAGFFDALDPPEPPEPPQDPPEEVSHETTEKQRLSALLLKTQSQKPSLNRTKRIKQIRAEMMRIKRKASPVPKEKVKEIQKTKDVQKKEIKVKESVKKEEQMSKDEGSDNPEGVDVEDEVISEEKCSPTQTVGVNRRTAVLFTRKAHQAALKKPEVEAVVLPPVATPDVATGTKETSRNQRRRAGRPKRNSDGTHNPDDPKKSVPDSFRVYRAGNQTSGDEESDSGTSLSTCYSFDLSDIESTDTETSQTENDGENSSQKSQDAPDRPELHPLQLVWAKCRGYPWYPALIIDPAMPKGYVHHGVPIPAPPQDVLALSSNYTEHVYLVLFFDAKRTWQWLPADKLEILGLDTEKDQSKVSEPRKPTDRKAVRKAYQHALTHQCQVSEPPGPDAIM